MKHSWGAPFLSLTTVGMEICWFYAILIFINKALLKTPLPVVMLLGILPLSFGFNTIVRRLIRSVPAFLIISWLTALLVTLLITKTSYDHGLFFLQAEGFQRFLVTLGSTLRTLFWKGFGESMPPDLFTLLGGFIIWAMGLRIAMKSLHFTTMVTEFQFGLSILLIVYFIESKLEMKPPALYLTLSFFFLFALSAMSVAHARERLTWISSINKGSWSLMLLIIIGAILILGLIVGPVLLPKCVKLAFEVLKSTWQILVALILKCLHWLMSLFDSDPALPPLGVPPVPHHPGSGSQEIVRLIPQWLRRLAGFIVTTGWLVLILVALWRVSSDVFTWLTRKLGGMQGAEFERLQGAFMEDLRRFFKFLFLKGMALLKRPFRRTQKSRMDLRKLGMARCLYREFLQWTASLGIKRPIWQTPYEFQKTLSKWFPGGERDLKTITACYVSARYGPSIPDEDDIEKLKLSLQHLKQTGVYRKGKAGRLWRKGGKNHEPTG